MIIKSMSRKHRSFSQLFNYMKNGSSQSSEYDFFSKNLYTNNGKEITAEFLRNARLLKARANGNYLFHEVISLTKSKQLTLEQEKERLFDIIRLYTEKRCDNNLVIGFLHDEKSNNIHYHLMISSNEVGEYKNQRLTKFDFDKVKKSTEKYVIDKYPELEQDIIINWQKNKTKKVQQKTKQSNKAGEVKRQGGRLEKKEKITNTLRDVFAKCHCMSELFTHLAEQKIEMYNRGKTIVFITLHDNKKYRLKTLGLEEAFHQIDELSRQSTKIPDEEVKRSSSNKKDNDDKSKDNSETTRRKAEIKKSRDNKISSNKKNDNDFER